MLHTKVDISPPAWTLNWTGYWGTGVTTFEVHERHEELEVSATSTVDVRRTPARGRGLGWEQLGGGEVGNVHSEYLELSSTVRPPHDLAEIVYGFAAEAPTEIECAPRVIDLIHREVRYMPRSTRVHTLAADSWQARAGVCQDMANLTIGCLRLVGVPACYVSGYLMPDPDPQVGRTYAGESHAWVRFWDGKWVEVDPASAIQPGDRHFEVAREREYSDVAPLRGIYPGSGNSKMFVAVELSRLA